MGLHLFLVQPSDASVMMFRAACLAAGTAIPAWLAYKAAKSDTDRKSKDRVLRLLVANGVLELGEKVVLGPIGLARWRYWPSAKFAVLLWLLLDGGKGADAVYDHVARMLRPYERDVDTLASAAAPLLHHAGHSYLTPVKAAACSCVAVCLAGFRLARARHERSQQQQQQSQQIQQQQVDQRSSGQGQQRQEGRQDPGQQQAGFSPPAPSHQHQGQQWPQTPGQPPAGGGGAWGPASDGTNHGWD